MKCRCRRPPLLLRRLRPGQLTKSDNVFTGLPLVSSRAAGASAAILMVAIAGGIIGWGVVAGLMRAVAWLFDRWVLWGVVR